jgi:hypothetical protein
MRRVRVITQKDSPMPRKRRRLMWRRRQKNYVFTPDRSADRYRRLLKGWDDA